jgi:outer membrane receptor protein involved in Fe transport
MGKPRLCVLAFAIASIYPAAHAADAAAAPAAAASQPDPAPQTIQITGRRLDDARSQLSPDTGSTVYRFDQKDIAALPLGDATPLNQVVLQAPGAVQDSYGQLHVRGDHANLQYRINGVVIPESISGFGQSLDTRLANQINILTGALPAQYGYRTAGVIDIHTKSGALANGGSVSLVGGTQGHAEASGELTGSSASGETSYFVTGSLLHDDVGIENPTPSLRPLHDHTQQAKGFGYLSHLIDANSRVSLMLGVTDNRFEIPDVPGQSPNYLLADSPPVDSATLNARQKEQTSFQVLTYQASPNDRLDYQLSVFHRSTDVRYTPDAVGDLVFNGVAADIFRQNQAEGVQGDWSYRLNDRHTVRAGLFAQHERFAVDNSSAVFPADADGNQTSDAPFTIVDDTRLSGNTFGVYLQDEWQPTKALTVNYGARFDHVHTVVNEQQFSPRLGAVYVLSAQTTLHAGYARYFTPPPTEKIDTTSVSKFQGTTNALPSDANTAVSSERSHYFDAGLSHQLTPDLTLDVDAYFRKVKNLQDEGQFGNALIFSAFNYQEGKIGGVEFSASYRHRDLSAYANLSISRALGRNVVTGQFNFDPDELAYIADHWVHLDHDQLYSASAGLSYAFGPTKWSTDLLYGSGLRSGFANSDHLAAYTQVNTSLSRSFDLGSFGKVDGRLAVVNLFDHVYELRDGSGIGVGAPQYGPRRGMFVGVTKDF